MDNNEPLRKCDTCKIIKPKRLFYRYKYCKRCHIKNYIKDLLLKARAANHLNLSIDEFNNIITNNMNDPTRDEIGEHHRYGELMYYYNRRLSSTIITDDVINGFLEEPF